MPVGSNDRDNYLEYYKNADKLQRGLAGIALIRKNFQDGHSVDDVTPAQKAKEAAWKTRLANMHEMFGNAAKLALWK